MRIASVLPLLALALLAACGGGHKTTTYNENGQSGSVTTDNSGKTTTYQNDKGEKAVVGQGAVDTSKLGAPVYPGSAAAADNALNVTSKTGTAQMASFTTDDAFDKVYQFYKDKMPAGSEKMKMDSGGSSVAEFVAGEEKTGQTTVMITTKDGKTQILISHGTTTGQ